MENLKLDRNHSLFQISPKVAAYFSDFSKQEGLSYFQYARLNSDGSILGLFSQVDLFQKFLDLGWSSISSFREEDKAKLTYSFFWDEDLPEEPVSLARSYSNIHHGMTLLRRSRSHYDMIAFGMDKPCSNPGGYYLTRLRALENFILSFENAFQDVIKNPGSLLVKPPPHQQDPNGPRIWLQDQNIPIQGLDGPTYITPRELECLYGWAKKLTKKEVGKQLDISPRTVETLLERCRIRTQLSLLQLSQRLNLCP